MSVAIFCVLAHSIHSTSDLQQAEERQGGEDGPRRHGLPRQERQGGEGRDRYEQRRHPQEEDIACAEEQLAPDECELHLSQQEDPVAEAELLRR